MAPKTIKVFKTKTIKIRNDFEQWCDVQGVEQTGGSDNELSTIVSHYNIQRNDDIVKDYFNFIGNGFLQFYLNLILIEKCQYTIQAVHLK